MNDTRTQNNEEYVFDESKIPNIVLMSVPYFFLFMGIEYLYGKFVLKRSIFRLNDTINSLSHGLFSEVTGIISKQFGIVPYVYIYTYYPIYRFALDSWISWILVLLGVDFGYYCILLQHFY